MIKAILFALALAALFGSIHGAKTNLSIQKEQLAAAGRVSLDPVDLEGLKAMILQLKSDVSDATKHTDERFYRVEKLVVMGFCSVMVMFFIMGLFHLKHQVTVWSIKEIVDRVDETTQNIRGILKFFLNRPELRTLENILKNMSMPDDSLARPSTPGATLKFREWLKALTQDNGESYWV